MTDSLFFLWLMTVGTLIGSFVFLSLRTTPQLAIGIVVGLTMVVPAWILIPLFDTPYGTLYGSGLDVKLAVTASCLFLYCFMPGRTFALKLVPSDFAMIALVVVHVTSDLSNSGFTWMILARIYAEWFAPYVAGRLAFQSLVIPDALWKTLAIASAVVGSFAIVESIFGLKVFEFIAGERPVEGMPRDAMRWGVLRAYGPTMHPIYFGGLQLLLLAWPAYGLARALQRQASYGWIFLPIFAIFGIIATGSRAPIIALILFAMAFIFFRDKPTRIPILVLSFLVIFVLNINFWWIIEKLEDWSGESTDLYGRKVQVDGEQVKYTGLRTRIIMLDVYRIAIKRSGLIGYGTIATSGFPVNVPISGQEVSTLQQIKFIDNAYVLMLLRFGYAGAVCFSLACFLSLMQFYWLCTTKTPRHVQLLCAALAASLVATYFLIATVWLPPDVSFPMLWTMGISTGLLQGHRTKVD